MIPLITRSALLAASLWLSQAYADTLQMPTKASYLTDNGAISIIGNDGMQPLIEQLNALFVREHPGFRFALTAKGSSTGLPALAAGATAIAPLAREPWLGDMNGFKQVFGHEPLDIRIGYSGYGPRAHGKTPPAVYVNPNNPLKQLSMEQLAKLMTAGQPGGDINTWGQLELSGPWAARRIHVYGLRDDGGFATNLRMARFAGLPFSPKYEALADRAAVLQAVADDNHGIAVVGWANAAQLAPALRIVPLSRAPGEPAYGPGLDDVAAGHYLLSAYLHLFVNAAPGQPLEPFIKQYLGMALSDEGQALVRQQTDSAEGYVPLSTADLARERKKLEGL
ncbi:PstS family phosphate ABC transporter substrate-binding protein [Pseudomonas typographi]|uniref:PstS family phosphate ABC transporter substrate-binding protein n=1 Tax=Pseudomonas typographi TaxID=2715964 RepID=UPI0016868F97|nr:substrate-binding domain-containing protein [Pseudomonas typographi]MBD1553250.1 phosphate-binding protein [Pseudomonas typographi]